MRINEAHDKSALIERLAYMQGFHGQPMHGVVLLAHELEFSANWPSSIRDPYYLEYQHGHRDRKKCIKYGYLKADDAELP